MSHVKNLIATDPNWMETLKTKHAVDITPDNKESPRLVSIKYNMLEADMSQPIPQESRGMVIDILRNEIVAFPYSKFFNYNEHLAAKIDWNTAVALDKLDGSLMILFYDKAMGEWSVASSGHPTAGGQVGEYPITFKELFWQTFAELGMKLPDAVNDCKDSCFMLELCCKENRIVVNHEKQRIVCHGARVVDTGEEWPRSSLDDHCLNVNWELVESFPLNTLDGVVAAAKNLNPVKNEGFIVVDANFNRVKVKSPQYVALHHIIGKTSTRGVIRLWIGGDVEELFFYFPEREAGIRKITDNIELIASNALADCLKNKDLPSRKDFALAVKDLPWSGVVFKLYQAKELTLAESRKIIRALPVNSIKKMLVTMGVVADTEDDEEEIVNE